MNQSSTPFNSPSATQSNPNPSLYDLFGSSGQSSILIAFIGTRWLIATIGVVLNLLLVWITIRNKSLQGTCNLFIAFDALSAALYQSSNSISLYVVVSGANFIPLKLCLYLMAFAILTITLSLCATFLIGFDRLLSVLFPILSFGSNQKSKIFMGFSLACSIAYALYVLWQCWAICMTIPDTPVMCSLSDCYPKEVGQMIFRNSMILIGLASLNYVIIWIGLKKKSANSNKGKATKSYTEKIFKSLSVITSLVLFGWMLNATARFVMPMLSLTQLQSFYISAILGCITNFALTCNAPVLYCFSKDYRKAFLNFYHGVEPSGSNAWAEKQVAGSIRRTRTENILR